MLRSLGNLTFAFFILCSCAFAVGAEKVTREVSDHAQNASHTAVDSTDERMVKIEVLIADLRHSEASMFDGPSQINPKERLQQLEKAGKLYSLTRVQLTTISGQKAILQAGQKIGRVTGVSRGGFGQVNSITTENVGLLIGVEPQVRSNGQVVMAIDIERSQLGPEEEGTPIFRSERSEDQPLRLGRGIRGSTPTLERSEQNSAPTRPPTRDAEKPGAISKPSEGETIRIPHTETFTNRTTIIARSGESVVGGAQQARRQARQSELLIVVTPELLGNDTRTTSTGR